MRDLQLPGPLVVQNPTGQWAALWPITQRPPQGFKSYIRAYEEGAPKRKSTKSQKEAEVQVQVQ
jgi:hypothetical protein